MAEITVNFVHSTNGKIMALSLEDTMTGSEVLGILFSRHFIPPLISGYTLAVSGEEGKTIPCDQSLAEAGVTDESQVRIQPNGIFQSYIIPDLNLLVPDCEEEQKTIQGSVGNSPATLITFLANAKCLEGEEYDLALMLPKDKSLAWFNIFESEQKLVVLEKENQHYREIPVEIVPHPIPAETEQTLCAVFQHPVYPYEMVFQLLKAMTAQQIIEGLQNDGIIECCEQGYTLIVQENGYILSPDENLTEAEVRHQAKMLIIPTKLERGERRKKFEILRKKFNIGDS